ncbi:hypothetical protein MAELSTROM_14 [Pseudoalteromonas phage Maelstrom]|uniref:hypothetical protein n=1 Tax=Pseudoalteromonas phage Maelstrom TaxID=2065202 RepID=UPI000CA23649|nr:hypothetical protein PP584_gp14 [Pseudoalteromonas phage Maelstrom]AUG84934.1 hypothetical protein MAELSTROM_14 [Pseudoalteromonas phage Maelstrom]
MLHKALKVMGCKMSVNREIPAGMTIVDNRKTYIDKEIITRLMMPMKTFELASLNRQERYAKGHKFQMNLRINRALKERKALKDYVIKKAKELGLTWGDF